MSFITGLLLGIGVAALASNADEENYCGKCPKCGGNLIQEEDEIFCDNCDYHEFDENAW